MSIINQMLKDLDKRKQPAGDGAAKGDVVRAVEPGSAWHRSRVKVGLVVGLGVAMLALGGWMQLRNKALYNPSATPAAPPIAAAASPSPATIPSPALPAAPPSPVAAAASGPVAAAAPSAATAAPRSPVAAASPNPVTAAAPSQGAAASNQAAAKPVALAAALQPGPAGPLATTGMVDAPSTPRTITPTSRASSAKTYSPRQAADNLLREAAALDQQGRLEEAKVPLRRALEANPLDVEARQMLIQVQLDTGHAEEAQSLLAEGHRLVPGHSGFSMALARLQLESGDSSGALRTLQGGLPTAGNEPHYRAFLAALLLRAQNYDAAVQHYLVALRSDPANATWLVGLGVALEAVGKRADAAEAYRRAGTADNLAPDVAKFLDERLSQLRH